MNFARLHRVRVRAQALRKRGYPWRDAWALAREQTFGHVEHLDAIEPRSVTWIGTDDRTPAGYRALRRRFDP